MPAVPHPHDEVLLLDVVRVSTPDCCFGCDIECCSHTCQRMKCGTIEKRYHIFRVPSFGIVPDAEMVHRSPCCPACCASTIGFEKWPLGATDEEKRLLMGLAHLRLWRGSIARGVPNLPFMA